MKQVGIYPEPVDLLGVLGVLAVKLLQLCHQSVTISEENFKSYGASTSPTVIVVDRAGMVRLYHPGQMKQEEIEPVIRAVVEGKAGTALGAGGR